MDNKSDFWKKRYQDSWELSNKKELLITNLIEEQTGFKVKNYGLGAGSIEFISGSAKDNNYVKGDPDLYIESIDTYLEVTGSNKPMDYDDALWFRPDKLNNAYKKLKNNDGKLHFLIHIIKLKDTNQDIIRCINMDNNFFKRAYNGSFKKVEPYIKGVQEKFIEINSDDESIISFNDMIKILMSL